MMNAKKRTHFWKVSRFTSQIIFLLLFLVFFIVSRRGIWSPSLINLPMHLDPLVMLSNLLASRAFQVASLISLLTIILTVVLGRVWCGWICPMGSILDFIPLKRCRDRSKSIVPESLRQIKIILLVVILVSALLGLQIFIFFDPLTILFRALSTSVLPAIDWIISHLEQTLYQIPFMQMPVGELDMWLRPVVLPPAPLLYRSGVFIGATFIAIILLNLIASRFWCRYLCPLGGLLGIISRFALVRRKVDLRCRHCSRCDDHCPTGTINSQDDFKSDPAECIVCLECLPDCPTHATTFTWQPGLSPAMAYDPGRRALLTATLGTIGGLAIAGSQPGIQNQHPFWILPPGARENGFMSKCIRCAECVRACPTSALQLSLGEAGLIGLGTPVLVPRLGFCEYSCHACGQVCPVLAIPALDLPIKQTTIIGKASIDISRCIAWSERRTCVVCEEMCPLPDKAIVFEEFITSKPGDPPGLQLPRVLFDRCIGCGICENRCPTAGEAAIRVFSPVSS